MGANGWITVGNEIGEITVVAQENLPNGQIVSGSLRIGCQGCGNTSCGIAQGTVGNSRNALTIGMGILPWGDLFMGSIRLKLTAPQASLTTPTGLTYDRDSTDNVLPEIIRDGGAVRQILAPQC